VLLVFLELISSKKADDYNINDLNDEDSRGPFYFFRTVLYEFGRVQSSSYVSVMEIDEKKLSARYDFKDKDKSFCIGQDPNLTKIHTWRVDEGSSSYLNIFIHCKSDFRKNREA